MFKRKPNNETTKGLRNQNEIDANEFHSFWPGYTPVMDIKDLKTLKPPIIPVEIQPPLNFVHPLWHRS